MSEHLIRLKKLATELKRNQMERRRLLISLGEYVLTLPKKKGTVGNASFLEARDAARKTIDEIHILAGKLERIEQLKEQYSEAKKDLFALGGEKKEERKKIAPLFHLVGQVLCEREELLTSLNEEEEREITHQIIETRKRLDDLETRIFRAKSQEKRGFKRLLTGAGGGLRHWRKKQHERKQEELLLRRGERFCQVANPFDGRLGPSVEPYRPEWERWQQIETKEKELDNVKQRASLGLKEATQGEMGKKRDILSRITCLTRQKEEELLAVSASYSEMEEKARPVDKEAEGLLRKVTALVEEERRLAQEEDICRLARERETLQEEVEDKKQAVQTLGALVEAKKKEMKTMTREVKESEKEIERLSTLLLQPHLLSLGEGKGAKETGDKPLPSPGKT